LPDPLLIEFYLFALNNDNMKLMKLIMGFFFKRESRRSPISEAVSEAFKETFKAMGYRFNDDDNKV
jgi:hypothetical protein